MQLCVSDWVAVWLSGNSKSPYTGGRDCKAGSTATFTGDRAVQGADHLSHRMGYRG